MAVLLIVDKTYFSQILILSEYKVCVRICRKYWQYLPHQEALSWLILANVNNFRPINCWVFLHNQLLKAFFPKKCFGRGDMNCDLIDCYHDDDLKGQWAIPETKYRLLTKNIIGDGGSTAL